MTQPTPTPPKKIRRPVYIGPIATGTPAIFEALQEALFAFVPQKFYWLGQTPDTAQRCDPPAPSMQGYVVALRPDTTDPENRVVGGIEEWPLRAGVPNNITVIPAPDATRWFQDPSLPVPAGPLARDHRDEKYEEPPAPAQEGGVGVAENDDGSPAQPPASVPADNGVSRLLRVLFDGPDTDDEDDEESEAAPDLEPTPPSDPPQPGCDGVTLRGCDVHISSTGKVWFSPPPTPN